MNQQKSVEEIKQIAETAIAARTKASEAKIAADAAGGTDESLNTAATEAEAAAKDAEGKAAALSQTAPDQDKEKKKAKLLKKREYINRDLRDLGVDDDEDDADEDDEDDLDDDDAPLTVGGYKKIQARNAAKSTLELINAIEDEAERAKVRDALKSVNPALITSDPQAAFNTALAIANVDRNTKILEEDNRNNGVKTERPRGAGAPPKKPEATFTPTAEERSYMRPPFNMTEAEIKAARSQ